MRRLSLIMLLALAVLAACGSNSNGITVNFVGGTNCDSNGQSPYSPSPPNTNSAPVGKPIDEMPHTHVPEGTVVQYNHDPPTSGCHYSLGVGVAPIPPGVYGPDQATKATKPLTAEYWVHNLEHGYIVVSYNCPTGCASELQSLTTWFQSLPPDPGGKVAYAKFIAVPYPAQKDTWDVESWDWFDSMGSTLSLSEVQKFYANHVNQAPEGAASG
ncbi:MAG TPA: DUF3105 domain-containing protein [Candidatus Dormibacteraeota bacterium]|nr:DUF3105 domain-containing protein [Candidatus Dormibacteraeota bacterium]